MNYNKLRNKTLKFYQGGLIPKMQEGSVLDYLMKNNGWSALQAEEFINTYQGGEDLLKRDMGFGENLSQLSGLSSLTVSPSSSGLSITGATDPRISINDISSNRISNEEEGALTSMSLVYGILGITSGSDILSNATEKMNTNLGLKQANWKNDDEVASALNARKELLSLERTAKANGVANSLGFSNWQQGAAAAGIGAMLAIDGLAMGDKNFGALSQAIDAAVHGASKALLSTGNPYAIAGAAALEGANFLTKAGGLTVLGFDVDINSSGYGLMGHKASSSSRDFGAMIGLGGLNRRRMLAKLAKRNELARMAMAAASIADDLKFESEARMNNVLNVLMNNLIALAGGVELNSLGS